jgi:hypothetical protein
MALRTAEQRLWFKVVIGTAPAHRPELGPCYVWTGALTPNGYGQIQIDGHNTTTNRYSLSQALGRALTTEEQACHSCDNRPCVRRSHLFLGTPRSNTADMLAKGRGRYTTHPDRRPAGERNWAAKLTEDAVRLLRRDLASGRSVRVCARAYGIAPPTVRDVRDGRTWQHVR